MLHRYRDVMVVPAREKLSGTVEMDETFIGGVKPGKRGRGAAGKVLVVGAIERAPKGRRGFGRARLAIAQNAKSDALREFITANIPTRRTTATIKRYSPAARSSHKYRRSRFAHVPAPARRKITGDTSHVVQFGPHGLFPQSKANDALFTPRIGSRRR